MMRQIPTTYVSSPSSGHTDEHTEFKPPREETANQMEDLVHELRQPLSVIESTAYYLEMVLGDLEITAHLKHIQKMVGETHRILERASAAHAVISEITSPAPRRAASRRNGASVTPDIGARKTRFARVIPPTSSR